MKKELKYSLLSVATLGANQATATAQISDYEGEWEHPNIIWFLTEDLSPHFLALFNDGKGAQTPNVERLAKGGVIYPNAYSSAPVSSAARTTLITGCYAPRFAGSLHRHIELNQMPDSLRMFPTYLRQNGYYTINANKRDYNVVLDKGAWSRINGKLDTWRERPDKNKPFFMQRSVMTTHESRLLFSEETYQNVKTKNDPAQVNLLPHTPDTELMRYTYATLYDRIQQSDAELGELLDMLEEDGEADNTIILFFGDNGGVMPGTKGYTDNIGVQVPLVAYIPHKWRKKFNINKGEVREDIISFIDMAATTLNLAGVDIPEQMDGLPFLGEGALREGRSTVCYGDRFDEMYSFNRSIRRGNFRYERNYQPYQPQSTFALYRYKQMAFREWRELHAKGELNEAQNRFFEPQGVEELYDLSTDPNELVNLAKNSQYQEVLNELRQELNEYLLDRCDLGFYPETIIHERAMANQAAFGEANRSKIEEYIAAADLQRLSFTDAKEGLTTALNSGDEVLVWWGLTTAAHFGEQAKELSENVEKHLTHQRGYIRSRAALALSMMGQTITHEELKNMLNLAQKDAETLIILNDFVVMAEAGLVDPFPLEDGVAKGENFAIEWRTRYLNSLWRGTPLSEICSDNYGN